MKMKRTTVFLATLLPATLLASNRQQVANTTKMKCLIRLALLAGILLTGCKKESLPEPSGEKSETTRRSTPGEGSASKSPKDIKPGQRPKNAGSDSFGSALSHLSADEVRQMIDSGRLDANDLVFALSSFAVKTGNLGNPEDLKFILEMTPGSGNLESVLQSYFESARDGGNPLGPEFVDNLNPGSKRDSAVRAYFGNPSLSIEDALRMLGEFSFSEDRRNALAGLSRSRRWLPSQLLPLVEAKEDVAVLESFLGYSLTHTLMRGGSGVEDNYWNDLSKIRDSNDRTVVANVLFQEIGIRNPSKAIELVNQLPQDQQKAILTVPEASKVIASWADKDPNACLRFVVDANLDPDVTERLVAKGVGQWLMLDSVAASQWLGQNTDKEYAQAAILRLISHLEQRGEDASGWKELITAPRR